MAARHPSIRIKGKKIDVRWRPVSGLGPQIYIPFDRPDGVNKPEEALEVPLIRLAYDMIDSLGCNVTREVVLAGIYKVDLNDVRVMIEEQRETRRLRKMPTVKEFVEPYLRHKAADERTTSGTRERYADHLRIAWLPVIGDMYLDEVTAKMIDAVMDEMSLCDCKSGKKGAWCARRVVNRRKAYGERHEPGIEKTTRDKYYAAVSGLFTYATSQFKIPSPVAESKYKPRPLSQYSTKTREQKHFYLSEAQFELLYSKMPEQVRLMLRLWSETGMRFSEITGLVPDQVKRVQGLPGIDLNEVVKHSKENGYYRGKPKNKTVRFIALAEETYALLEAYGKKARTRHTEEDLLFATVDGYRMTANNFRRDVWDPAVTAAMRCPVHPPAGQSLAVSPEGLAGPRCGDNGGLNARGKPCGFRVQAGTDRCYGHQGVARDAVSTCSCDVLEVPLRLPRSLTPHDLRHTYNSWMQSWNVHQYQMAKRMGNSVAVNEAVYGGVPQEAEIALAQRSVRRGPISETEPEPS